MKDLERMAVISNEEEEEDDDEGKKKTRDEDDDQMTLAQLSQSATAAAGLRSPYSTRTPKPLTSAMVVSSRSGMSSSCKRKQESSNFDEDKLSAIERAKNVQETLAPGPPSFVKCMLRSHVTDGFWMGLPAKFCSAHLPKQDVAMTLVDESQEEYITKFLPRKSGLSGGWKWFAVAHGLVEGDALLFQLVKATTFQVYIIRAHSPGAMNGIIGLLTLGSLPKHDSICRSIKNSEKYMRKRRKTATLAAPEHPTREKSESDVEILYSEAFEGIGFKEVKDLESFAVVVDGLVIDSELSSMERTKYYELCCSQDAFLHDTLLEGINMKLAAGAISQTVYIADAIKTSKLSTSANDFAAWDKCLGALKQLGMNVGFLRARVQKLFSIANNESEEVVYLNQYTEAIAERAHVEQEMRA